MLVTRLRLVVQNGSKLCDQRALLQREKDKLVVEEEAGSKGVGAGGGSREVNVTTVLCFKFL